jgi:putative addiction module component (TIGR02574 family)
MTIDQIASEALRLPPRERALLAGSLWESLEDPSADDAPMDDAAVVALAVARDQQMEAGQVQHVSHEQMMTRLRR